VDVQAVAVADFLLCDAFAGTVGLGVDAVKSNWYALSADTVSPTAGYAPLVGW
jgi:hypothetical protein